MSGLPPLSAASGVWPRGPGFSSADTGPTPFGGNSTGLPVVNNSNLPSAATPNVGYQPPANLQRPFTPFPSLQQPSSTAFPSLQQPSFTPFPSLQQPFGRTNTLPSANYGTVNTFPLNNQVPFNAGQNLVQSLRNEGNDRRLIQLENENTRRRNATSTLQQMGTHILQGQMEVQEQVLQYQFMLEQCMETLDHQNFVLTGQSEELALFRAKMRHFEYFMDTLKLSKEANQQRKGDSNFTDIDRLCSRNPLSLPGPSGSAGGVTRVTSSHFQPFNPRYRSPNSRTSNINERRSATPAIPKPTVTTGRLSRPISNLNN